MNTEIKTLIQMKPHRDLLRFLIEGEMLEVLHGVLLVKLPYLESLGEEKQAKMLPADPWLFGYFLRRDRCNYPRAFLAQLLNQHVRSLQCHNLQIDFELLNVMNSRTLVLPLQGQYQLRHFLPPKQDHFP